MNCSLCPSEIHPRLFSANDRNPHILDTVYFKFFCYSVSAFVLFQFSNDFKFSDPHRPFGGNFCVMDLQFIVLAIYAYLRS